MERCSRGWRAEEQHGRRKDGKHTKIKSTIKIIRHLIVNYILHTHSIFILFYLRIYFPLCFGVLLVCHLREIDVQFDRFDPLVL